MTPCASRAPSSPASPIAYDAMKYACTKISTTIADASTKLIHRKVRLMRASLSSWPDSVQRVRIHVTGATGYLGSELTRRAPQASAERAEVRDAGAVRELFERVRPDVVIHTAYRQDGPDAPEINVDGSETVARAAAAVGARLVHLSTDVVFDGRKGAPYVESDPPAPVTDYGRTKAEAEARVAAVHPDALLVRTSLLYGGAEASKHELAARDPRADLLHGRDPQPRARRRSRGGSARAGRARGRGAAARGRRRRRFAGRVGRADRRAACARPPRRRPARPLDCTLDSSRAQALIRTRLRGVREVLASG